MLEGEALKNQLGQQAPHRTGEGNKNIAHTQEYENYFNGKNDCREQEEISKKKNDAATHAFFSFADKKTAAEPQE
ncbi:MAG TPA: hypothetical protein VLX68_04600 [Chitinivibrionales bacterium]|nr:hypothetical protein [Chitinivibrionales bacterium]